MRCPNCSAQADDGAGECAACGVIFAKWRPREARLPSPEAAAPGAARGEKAEAALPAYAAPAALAALVLSAGSALLFFSSPSGRGVPPSAVKLPGGFSVRPPDGWQVAASECPAGTAACAAAAITRAADPAAALAEASGGFPVAVAAEVFSTGPRVARGLEDKIDAAYLARWRSQVDSLSSELSRDWTPVDGLPALRVTGGGPKRVREELRKPLIMKETQAVAELRRRNPTKAVISYEARMPGKAGDLVPDVVVDPGEYRDAEYEIALGALLVSGRRHTLLFSCRAQQSQKAECAAALDAFAQGLRVTDRPRRLELWSSAPLSP